MDENLTAKIKKLFALSSSSYEAEAKAALLKAQQLMEEHGVSMAQVSSANTDPANAIDAIAEMSVDKGSSQIASWQKRLATIIAENFRCRVFFRSYRNHTRDLMIYGMREDVEVAKPTLEFALLSARNSWAKYRAARQRREGRPPSRAHTEAIKNDYMRAFAQGVREAFAKQVREKAIVLKIDKKVTRYAEEVLHLSSESIRRVSTMHDDDARSSGYSDGLRIRGGDKLANSQLQITS